MSGNIRRKKESLELHAFLWAKDKRSKEETKSHSPTKRTLRNSAGSRAMLTPLWRLWICWCWVYNVFRGKITGGKRCLYTELTGTKHDLEANGGNPFHYDENESGTWYDDSRIRRKLVDMKNGTVVCSIGCECRFQLNISLAHVLKKKKKKKKRGSSKKEIW